MIRPDNFSLPKYFRENTLEEWISLEAASYADYLRAMSGDHLVEEYHRQGGEDIVYYDPSSDRIVDNAGGVDGCPDIS